MFYNLEVWQKSVDKSQSGSRVSVILIRILKPGENFGTMFSSSYSKPNERAYVSEIVNMLFTEEVLGKDGSVLDISCGPGTYSIPFLKAGAEHVDCVDISQGMLAELKKGLKNEKLLDRADVFRCTWNEFESIEKYDLVFCSMSPAISEFGELMRMEEFSRKSCCLITYGSSQARYQIHDILWEKLSGYQIVNELFDAIFPFNILCAMGRHPNMKNFRTQTMSRMSLEKACEYYQNYFEIFGYTSDEDKQKIRTCLEEAASDGVISENTGLCNSVIYWEIPK